MRKKPKASDELRQWSDQNCGGYIDGELREELFAIADRIDRETVELPKDMDGAPIHVGDTVYLDDGSVADVARIFFMPTKAYTICCDGDRYTERMPENLTHNRPDPDSFERIADELDEIVDAADSADDTCEKIADLAERIRKLAKED